MMTKDEFKKALWDYKQEQRYIGDERSLELRTRAGKRAAIIRKDLLDTYDSLAVRIAELEAQVAAMDREMKSMAATSDGFQMDAMFARERIAELEAVLKEILVTLKVEDTVARVHTLLCDGDTQ